jgi:hypothetical protein
MKENLAALEKTARDVSQAVKDAVAVGADVMRGDSVAKSESAPDDKVGNKENPFGKLNL